METHEIGREEAAAISDDVPPPHRITEEDLNAAPRSPLGRGAAGAGAGSENVPGAGAQALVTIAA